MATITSLKQADELRRYHISGAQMIDIKVVGAADTADSGDDIEVFDIPPNFVFYPFSFGHDSTLGASCTAQLRAGTTALTAATTAGGSSSVAGNGTRMAPSTSATTLNILIGGADIASAANFFISGIIAPAETIELS